jgi:hypothetical protein
MFEQKSCIASIMVEQKSCFAPNMFEQKLCVPKILNKSLVLHPK